MSRDRNFLYKVQFDGKIASCMVLQIASDEEVLEKVNTYLEEVKIEKRWTLEKLLRKLKVERIADGKRLRKVPLQLMSTDESEVENNFIERPIEIIDLPAVVPSMTETAV